MSAEAKPGVISILPGQEIKIVSPEKPFRRGEISQLSRTGLLYLLRGFGREIYNSELGSDSEFGNTKDQRREADPVVNSLRNEKVTTIQVRDVILNIAEGYSTPGFSTRGEKVAWANRVTLNLKAFTDQVLGKPDPADYYPQKPDLAS